MSLAVESPVGRRGLSPVAVKQGQLMAWLTATHSCSRRMFFRTFPVDVLGSGPKSTATGALKWARCCRQKSMMSRSSACAPGASVTNAFGRSPHRGSGMAITAHTWTAGWRVVGRDLAAHLRAGQRLLQGDAWLPQERRRSLGDRSGRIAELGDRFAGEAAPYGTHADGLAEAREVGLDVLQP